MVQKPSQNHYGPVPIGDVIAELAGGAPIDLAEIERRRLAAQQFSQRNLLEGAADHHRELLADPNADPEAVIDSRRGLQGDEADLLAVDPTAHDIPQEEA